MSQYYQLLKACINVIVDYTQEVSPSSTTLAPSTDYESIPGDTLATLLTERIDALTSTNSDKIPFLKYMTYILARCWHNKNEIWSDSTYQEIHVLCYQFLSNIALLMQQSNTIKHEIIYAETTISVSGFLNGWLVSSTSKSRLGTILQRCLEEADILSLIEKAQKDKDSPSKLIHHVLQLHQLPIIKAAHTTSQTEIAQLLNVQHRIMEENKALKQEIETLQMRLNRLLKAEETPLQWSQISSAFFRRLQKDLTQQPGEPSESANTEIPLYFLDPPEPS